MSSNKKFPYSAVVAGVLSVFFVMSGLYFSGQVGVKSVEAVAGASSSIASVEAVAPASGDSFDIEVALSERGLGDPSAPVRIDEFASLSCGHCAHFHNTVLKELKEKYMDTGKVYFVFNDFPLNASALTGTKIARCLPKDRYVGFVDFLFSTQQNWAFGHDYLDKLKRNARLAGLSGEKLDACLANKKLEIAMSARMSQASEKYKIESTPTFIFDNGVKTFSGGRSLAEFSEVIDALLLKKEVGTE